MSFSAISYTLASMLLVSMSSNMVAGHVYMSDPEARNVHGNPDRQSLAAGGPSTVLQDGQYRHGLCGNKHTDALQNWNEPMGIKRTYTEGQEIDISVVVTAHHIGYFDFQLCDTTDISEECFAQHQLTRTGCEGSGSVDDPNCERWWKPLALHETMAWVVTANGGYQYHTLDSGTVMVRTKFVLPQGVTCTNCVLRFHYYSTNSCRPENQNDDSNMVSEEFWNCADIQITGAQGTRNTDATPALVADLKTRVPQNLKGTGMDNFCPRHGLGEIQEYANVAQCVSYDMKTLQCDYPGNSDGNGNADKCANIACGAHGICESGNCECIDGYTGASCDTPPLDGCATVDCGSHGSCSGGVCTCTDGYSGKLCTDAGSGGDGDGVGGDLVQKCKECRGCLWDAPGACYHDWDKATCDRYAGYTYCGNVGSDLCQNTKCGVHSSACNAGQCTCTDGYTGPLCDVAQNVCATVDCGSNGICELGVCKCTNGFSGDLCQNSSDACYSLNCGLHGYCESGVCTCENGYTGSLCTIPPASPCDNINCGQYGSCTDGMCVCLDGYTGTLCDTPASGTGDRDPQCGTCGGCLWKAPNACYATWDRATCERYTQGGYTFCGTTGGDGNKSGNDGEGGDSGSSACDTVDCGAHGSCDAGMCNCDAGYTGLYCDVIQSRNIPTGSIRNLLSSAQFDVMFNLRQNSPNCNEGISKLTYENFVTAVDTYYPAFANEGSDQTRLREIAAFLGQISQETTGWWPGQEYGWGLCFIEEVACRENGCPQYSQPGNAQYPAVEGKSYHGRGAIQITWNYNYGSLSEELFNGDKNVLLQNPDLLTEDGVVAFRASLWFWMTAQDSKPSSHDVMIDVAPECPSARRYNGYGRTTNIINGGLECQIPTPAKVQNRVNYYERYCSILGVDPGQNLYCDQMLNYLSGVQCRS
ncbi:hypothetical protein SARC_00678 [Sphaeroforma arctica JP610]|uniref:Chitinase n=1 Tax=Sphaeroforma arctica JP610 TaxID=667725 RepID=A0A0L0GE94_9EUKA|nr:hypothetical protein SARC_00678 [Sphaeroforma arctica JP610]KNC87201.1 hypothetical protein SARC_00678 [Sphaeroforma arctica JP610]|eukprot:XP_014161103.1 hypothetical protein SARC_00678 [Sphaeroforma arctica JP610]